MTAIPILCGDEETDPEIRWQTALTVLWNSCILHIIGFIIQFGDSQNCESVDVLPECGGVKIHSRCYRLSKDAHVNLRNARRSAVYWGCNNTSFIKVKALAMAKQRSYEVVF